MDPIDQFLKNKEYRTQKNYKWILNEYFREIKQDPETYIKKNKDYREEIKNWWEQHLNEVPKTRHTKLGVIKSFLEFNEIIYPKAFWIERRREKKGRRAATLDRVPSAAEFKIILLHGDVKDKALFLFLSTSGVRIDEALKIKPNMIDLEHDPPMIKLPANITKTGDPRITFITPECKSYLLEWLKLRKAYIKRAVKRTGHICTKNPDDDRIFPFSYDVAWTRWKWLITKAGLNERDSTTDRYILHIHCLRKYFMSQLKLELPNVIPEALAGHEEYLDEAYRRYTQEQLGEEYKKGMHCLTVFERAPDLTGVNESLKEKDKQIQGLKDMMDELKAQVLELRLEKLEKANGTKK